MFTFSWAEPKTQSAQEPVPAQTSRLSPEEVECVGLSVWDEHCLECAPPQCYATCTKYLQREDTRCRRLSWGFVADRRHSGLFDYGVDCRFLPWAKIETRFSPAGRSPRAMRRLDRLHQGLVGTAMTVSRLLRPLLPGYTPHNLLIRGRNRWLERHAAVPGEGFDEFVLECVSAHQEPFRLVLQCIQDGRLRLQHAFNIEPGLNHHTLPFSRFGVAGNTGSTKVLLFPENDIECRLVFTWLHFVRYRKAASTATEAPAAKVKCVAWDLDNTLWNGVLIEDGADKLSLRSGIRETIVELDRRGIIQTVVSKNTLDEAWPVLEKLGLAEYFVYPAINWGAKSENLKTIARRLNIGIDSFALVDDSSHERRQVGASLPMVRLYTDTEATSLSAQDPFDVPVTAESARRRRMYQEQIQREEVQARFGEDYREFLRSLGMRLEIFTPTAEADRTRCHELLQRSNQLNLTTKRFSPEEFDELLRTSRCYAFRCEDDYGDYGLVGFLSLETDPHPRLENLVISCRIAQKRVEHALLFALVQELMQEGASELRAELIKTRKNGPLAAVFEDLPFERIEESEERIVYRLARFQELQAEGIVHTVLNGQPVGDSR